MWNLHSIASGQLECSTLQISLCNPDCTLARTPTPCSGSRFCRGCKHGFGCRVDGRLDCQLECCTPIWNPIQFFGRSTVWSASIHTQKILECLKIDSTQNYGLWIALQKNQSAQTPAWMWLSFSHFPVLNPADLPCTLTSSHGMVGFLPQTSRLHATLKPPAFGWHQAYFREAKNICLLKTKEIIISGVKKVKK